MRRMVSFPLQQGIDQFLDIGSGLDVIRRVSQATPRTRIVVLSMYDVEAYA